MKLILDVPVLTLLNTLLCLIIMAGCFYRMVKTSTATKVFPRIAYVFVFVAAFCNAFRGPLFGTLLSSWWPLVGSVCMLLLLAVGQPEWRGRVPDRLQRKRRIADREERRAPLPTP